MFVLASDKDLAVSPLDFARGKPRTYTRIIRIARTLSSFELRRLCSHLYHYWRRVLPAIFLPSSQFGGWEKFGLSSPPEHVLAGRLPCLLEQLYCTKNKKRVKY